MKRVSSSFLVSSATEIDLLRLLLALTNLLGQMKENLLEKKEKIFFHLRTQTQSSRQTSFTFFTYASTPWQRAR
jgi:hypothetical protein